jgi:hypothetical protein
MAPFYKNNVPYNKGKPLSLEHRSNISAANIGKVMSSDTRLKLHNANLGKIHSEETRKKISVSKKGTPAWNRGIETPYEVRLKQRDAKLKNPPPGNKNIRGVKYWYGRHRDYNTIAKSVEYKIGGFWYGNVRYPDPPQYCEKFNRNLKNRVRAYFGYKCFECGVSPTTSDLDVHHIHYNKKTCCDGSPHDMIPLCRSCHMKTNADRDYWERRYTMLLYLNNPAGKCYFTFDEMEDVSTTAHKKAEPAGGSLL